MDRGVRWTKDRGEGGRGGERRGVLTFFDWEEEMSGVR